MIDLGTGNNNKMYVVACFLARRGADYDDIQQLGNG